MIISYKQLNKRLRGFELTRVQTQNQSLYKSFNFQEIQGFESSGIKKFKSWDF